VLKCALQTPTTGRDATYNLNVERRHAVWVTVLWSEIEGVYNTPDTMVEVRSIKVGREIRLGQ